LQVPELSYSVDAAPAGVAPVASWTPALVAGIGITADHVLTLTFGATVLPAVMRLDKVQVPVNAKARALLLAATQQALASAEVQ
jgi:hypothetical protein